MKVCAIIPVKSTSSRVVSKNIRLLVDKPLYLHTLSKLLDIDEINEVWIDTDDISIIRLAEYYGYSCENYPKFKYFIRDKMYADNRTDGNVLLKNEIDNIESDIYIQVLCTSPFISSNNIITCINTLRSGHYKSVVGVFKDKYYMWNEDGPKYDSNNIPNSNTLQDTIIEAMSIYGITKEEFEKTKLRIGSQPAKLFLENDEIIDINYEKDFIFANKIATLNNVNFVNQLNMMKIKLNSCILSDILNEMGYGQYVLQNFRQSKQKQKLFGRVRPIQIRPIKEGENPDDIYKCLHSYRSVNYGNIIFVNNLVDDKAYFGDLNATIAISKGCQGTIVNGSTRDIERVNDLNYPVFYKNNTCSDVKQYGTLDYYDKPIIVDNVKIYVNDLVFADCDGVVVIPKYIERIVIGKCKEVIKKENNIQNSLIMGINISDIIDKFGTF